MKNKIIYFLLAIITAVLVSFFDMGLVLGLGLSVFLSLFSLFIFKKMGIIGPKIYWLFWTAFFAYLVVTLFFHYSNVELFGGSADSIYYDLEGQRLALRFSHFNFSFSDVELSNFYPIVVGFIYFITLPKIIIPQLFNVWLAALSAIFVYLIIRELGKSEMWAFVAGLVSVFYPSHLLFGGILLKDTLIMPLVLLCLLLTIKILKKFSWINFLSIYIILLAITNLRIYIGFALIITFLFSWLFVTGFSLRQKISYVIIFAVLMGFIPFISTNQGYYGLNFLNFYLKKETITFFREKAYVPSGIPDYVKNAPPEKIAGLKIEENKPVPLEMLHSTQEIPNGGATNIVKVSFNNPFGFVASNFWAFITIALGPFPWQLRRITHFFALAEILPWYLLMFFTIKGIFKSIREKRTEFLPLIIFSLIAIGVLSLYIASNFGVYMRIRTSVFLALICLAPNGFLMEPEAILKKFLCQIRLIHTLNPILKK